MVMALLGGEGYEVIEAKNGEEALQLAEQHIPDVVLLDLGLPTKSGLDVLRELKHRDPTRSIPVIVVSAYSTLMSDDDAKFATGTLHKPFNYEDLVDQVGRAAQPSIRRAQLVA
jgi:CheY-like chemotaxis protein